MKSHWTTYILFVVVVIIWGLVAKRIFFDKPERPNIISESDIKSDYAEYSYETDTLLCNYADPFQIESKLPQERKPNVLKKNSLPMKNKRKKVLMHYFGSVRSGKMLLHIVDINDACYEVLGNYVYKILPDAFFQVNTDCALMLYNQVLEYLDLHQDDVVLDLYCGAGSIGIYISDIPKKILGVEVNADAFESAIVNAKINDISKIDFMCAKVEDIINSIDYYPNKIIVDPPRSGLDQKTIEYLNQSKAEILVYVSCDPVTLARDLKLLNNYEVLEITPFDMFSQTYHVECVVKLCHKIDK